MECNGFSLFYRQSTPESNATVFSDLYSVWLLDARQNPLHVENNMAVIFERNFCSISSV